MKKLLMKFKVNMLFVVILSLVAEYGGRTTFDNRWVRLNHRTAFVCFVYLSSISGTGRLP